MEEEEITEEETKQDITTLIEDNVTAMENNVRRWVMDSSSPVRCRQ